MTKRKALTVTERYATIILDLRRGDGTPVIDREAVKHLTAGEIVSMFESALNFDHGVYVAFGGSNHPTNLTPRTIAGHRQKTKTDRKNIDKARRLEEQHREFRSRLLAKSTLADDVSIMDSAPKVKSMRGRPLAGTKASGLKKKFSGAVERRITK